MLQAINEINRIFTTAIDNAAPTPQPTQPEQVNHELTTEQKQFFSWLARMG